MKRKYIWIIVVVALLLVGLIVVLNIVQKKRDARPFKRQDFSQTIAITNGTEHRVDTIALVLADKIFDMDTIELIFYPIPKIFQEGDMEFYAIVSKVPFGENKFLILLDRKMSFSKMLTAVSHEFIHIEQYRNGDLDVYGKYAIWKGDTIDMSIVKYDDRPFEKDAFKNQESVKKKLKELLY
jgi:hypothetical protein